jgi:hypothetical protein
MFAVSDAVLNAWIARARRDDAGAIDAWRTAVVAEDALSYNEPADWYYPTRESLGAALLRAKEYGQAEEVFRQDLTRNPGNGVRCSGCGRRCCFRRRRRRQPPRRNIEQPGKTPTCSSTRDLLELRH